MKKTIFGIIITLILILSLAMPVMATPTHSISISDFKVELISGGQVGVETTIRISANINAESISDVTRYKDMAVCTGHLKYYVIDSTWYLIGQDKIEQHIQDYEYPSSTGDGAHAVLDWQASVDYTWIPYISGTHYVGAEIMGFTSVTDGSWPPHWIYDYQKEYKYALVEISDAPLGNGWLDDESFEVSIGDGFTCHESYSFENLVLGENINQECVIGDNVIGLQISAGTTILGTGKMLIDYDGTNIIINIPTDAIFSNPVTVTVDNIPILVFTSISGGIPQ